MNEKIVSLCVDYRETLISAMRKMDNIKHRLLIVTQNGQYLSLISIGDIQRAILAGHDLKKTISSVLRSEIVVASVEDDIEQVKTKMRLKRIEFMPIIDKQAKIKDVIFWDDLFPDGCVAEKKNISLPVVIMAGGQGTRLAPLTNVLPKPLVPISDKSIIEEIVARFSAYGCSEYWLSVNYKKDVIKQYLSSKNIPGANINYIEEDRPMGTGGSLFMLKDKIASTFFVTNCDILIKQDYNEILSYHRKNANEITIVAAVKNYSIPYGTLSIGENGKLLALEEKPDLNFFCNTGFYILEPSIIDEMEEEFCHITEIIEKYRKAGRRIGVFPVSEKSWIDIGTWEEYLKTIKIE